MKHILVVDDDPIMVSSLKEGFELESYHVDGTSNYYQTLELIEKKKPDIVILDIFFGQPDKRSGIEVLKSIRQRWDQSELPVFMITGQGESPELLESMDQGATDFISKPFAVADLIEKVKRTLSATLPYALRPWNERIVGKSKKILDNTMQLWKAAEHRWDTLILGETGTGKDLLARIYHSRSSWCSKPLTTIYCTNFASDTLFESELFGHKKGSFTGAIMDKMGKIQEADGGIVFLNEIGEVSLAQQAKLLNLLDNKTITPLGAKESEAIKLDVLILAATNCNLKAMVEKGEFRRDLYHRLCKHVIIEIPPLREHLEDIPLLVAHFLDEINLTARPPVLEVDPEVIQLFQQLYWDGNVRQLRNCIQDGARKCIGGSIILHDIQGYLERHNIFPLLNTSVNSTQIGISWDSNYQTFKQEINGLYKKYIEYHLKKHQGNSSKTARAIGMKTHQQLDEMIRRLGIKKSK